MFWLKAKYIKRLFASILVLLLFWWISKENVQIREVNSLYAWHPPKVVWDFVADLNHMKITNPGLQSFEIISDDGTHPEWHYGAVLHEQREQFGTISINADYVVKPNGEDYMIICTYEMCKLYMCAHINSTMLFVKHEDHKHFKTKLAEMVDINLPFLLSLFIDSQKITEYHKSKLLGIVSYLQNNMPN